MQASNCLILQSLRIEQYCLACSVNVFIVTMTIWKPDLSRFTGPKHLALAEAIREAVDAGTLLPDSQLPPQRDLAFALGLSLGTVTRAYKDAERRGLLRGEVGRGTFVRRPERGSGPPNLSNAAHPDEAPIDLIMNLPPPGQRGEAFRQTLAALAAEPGLAALLDHQRDGWIERHSRSMAAWLGRTGIEADVDSVVLTNGAQHAILSALMAVTRPGDVVLAERLTYPPMREIAHHLGLRLVGLDMDADGLVPAAVDRAARGGRAKVLYCMPTLHSPTGITMSEARRRDLARVAGRHGLVVIEDDVFGLLPEERAKPLACWLPGRAIYVTSASKTMAPGLRIGMMHTPAPLHRAVRNVIQMSCWMPAPIMAEVVHRWISDGTADRLNAAVREEMRARCKDAQQTLGHRVVGQDALRFHLWLKLPDAWSEMAFRDAAAQRGVRIATGETFSVKPGYAPGCIRLALGCEARRHRLLAGLHSIAELLAAKPRSPLVV
jgi:DNA-binding transcriptional MocR family regulator